MSKTHCVPARQSVRGLREERGLAAAREACQRRNQPAKDCPRSVAERGSGTPEAVDIATVRRKRMRALIDAIEVGAFGDVPGILHIGIGGSALGPALLVDALGRRRGGYKVRFLSNIDGEAFEDAVGELDPATTLVVVASKTFTTPETLANLAAARLWLDHGEVDDPDGRLIAVTAKPEAAVAAGIDETRVLQFGQGLGGRYSLWSSVGISAALALGWTAFEELLEGAAEMDRHFRFAEPASNAPLVAAFADRLYAQKLNCQTRGVFAYDERLRLLPSYLQQLEMKNLRQSVNAEISRRCARRPDMGWDRTMRSMRSFNCCTGNVLVPVGLCGQRGGRLDRRRAPR